MRTLVVIPAYNEQDSLAGTVEELKRCAPGLDYLVVNDGSSDNTERICRENGYPHVSHPTNLGLTAGFQTGCLYALEHGYDALVQFDADGQHVPTYLPALMGEMERTGADIVIGSRFVSRKKPLSARMIGSRLICSLIRLTSGVRLTDPTSGMRLYDRRAIREFVGRVDFGPEPDSIAFLARKGFKVTEVQVEMREREAGESYLDFGRSVSYMARTCVSILFVQWFR